jgi:4-carboxymuconolactone decarboxylase
MPDRQPASEARELLRRLASGDERSLQSVLAPDPSPAAALPLLDRLTRTLVRLAALLVLDGSAESLSWAVELASTTGAGDDALVAVLLATGPAAGSAQLVASAPRLALALGVEPAPDPASRY